MASLLKNSLGDDWPFENTNDPKTWYGRKHRVGIRGSTENSLFAELKFTAELLRRGDHRNKYAWSHRQWALEKLGKGYTDELRFCDEFCNRDTDNRLIWDQRCFAVKKCLAKGWVMIRSCEVSTVVKAILRNPEHENPWRYLRLLYKDDMKALARHTHLQWAFFFVFVDAINSVNAVRADKEMYKHYKHAQLFDSINKKSCLFALDLISDLLKHEYQPNNEVEESFDEVFHEYDGNTFAEKVDSVLREHRLELMELCADFTGTMNDITVVLEGAIPGRGVQRFLFDDDKWKGAETEIPCSELCGKAGFSPFLAMFNPQCPDWLYIERRTRFWAGSYERVRERRIRPPTEEVTKDGHEDKYSVLPESLRNSWREMDTYSDSYLDENTQLFMQIKGHFDPKPWQLRRLAVHERGFCLDNEVEVLELVNKTTRFTNYQYWHHRRWVSEKIGSDAAANYELEFTAKILSEHPNNIHAWSHREWVCKELRKDWGKAELVFCSKILKEDAYNSYAWNQRYFVLQKHPKWHEIRGNEVKYAIDAIRAEPENEMPWTYLKCLVSGKNYKVLNNSSTFVLSDVVRHINEGKVDICDAYVKRRVVNALKMVLFAIKQKDFKPNHDLKTSVDYLCPPEAAEESFAVKVVSIVCSMDVTCM
ncbi:hypothetical protein CASFOL_038153 [Castilleja foliolosa]|uniref:Protein farnesyltransferase/geranylgeranyltransferase type-1 subunit alpha n=1 Tax=Castilleja foliolosa TaxID=1961234 RepID=A0ABD3BKM2_9LAMI